MEKVEVLEVPKKEKSKKDFAKIKWESSTIRLFKQK